MKYLLQDYCPDYSSYCNYSSEEMEYREKMWEQQCILYDEHFKKIKGKLDKSLADHITSDFFHDSFIQSIELTKAINSDVSIIRIVFFREDLNTGITLEYLHVINFKTDLDFREYLPFGDYRYGEFLYDNGQYTHSFVLRENSEIEIKCKSIKVLL